MPITDEKFKGSNIKAYVASQFLLVNSSLLDHKIEIQLREMSFYLPLSYVLIDKNL